MTVVNNLTKVFPRGRSTRRNLISVGAAALFAASLLPTPTARAGTGAPVAVGATAEAQSARPACFASKDGSVIVLHGGGVGGGAAEAGLLYSYLKGGGPLPKCIVGSSIGAMIAVSLHQAAAEAFSDGPAAVRRAMLDTLERMFVGEFPKANVVSKVLGLLPIFNADALPKSQAADFLEMSGLAKLPIRTKAPFDVGVAVTTLGADGAPADSHIVWNTGITSEMMNATAAHKHVQPVNRMVDGNYGDYLGVMSRHVQHGQVVQFFTTYSPSDTSGTANAFAASGIAALESKGAVVGVRFAPVIDKQRHDMSAAPAMFQNGVELGKTMFRQRLTAPDAARPMR